jgi:hypothetical protein
MEAANESSDAGTVNDGTVNDGTVNDGTVNGGTVNDGTPTIRRNLIDLSHLKAPTGQHKQTHPSICVMGQVWRTG